MKELKLGMIGLSEGNGHPYSWSAIFNGYDKEKMSHCPFPVIPAYLAKENYPDAAIKNARVTHIWTQDKTLSHEIMKTTNIDVLCDHLEDMIPHVDAVLLARDDAENHYEMAKPFLKAGLPIYIDKPLAYHVLEAEKIYSLEQYPGQIFTCSALSYSQELQLTENQKEKIGDIIRIESQVMKSWKKYGIHIIDPVLNLTHAKPLISQTLRQSDVTTVEIYCEHNITLLFSAYEKNLVPIEIKIFGEKDNVTLKFSDTFSAFKSALQAFVNIVLGKEKIQDRKKVLDRIAIIEQGIS